MLLISSRTEQGVDEKGTCIGEHVPFPVCVSHTNTLLLLQIGTHMSKLPYQKAFEVDWEKATQFLNFLNCFSYLQNKNNIFPHEK